MQSRKFICTYINTLPVNSLVLIPYCTRNVQMFGYINVRTINENNNQYTSLLLAFKSYLFHCTCKTVSLVY